MGVWTIKLDDSHKIAFEEIARTSRRSAPDAVRYVLDRYLALRALQQSPQRDQRADSDHNPA